MDLEKVISDPFGSVELWDLDDSTEYSYVPLEKEYRFDIAFKKVNIPLNAEYIYLNRIMNDLFITSVKK